MVVRPGMQPFATLAKLHETMQHTWFVHEEGPLVCVRRVSHHAFPNHLQIVVPTMTVAAVLKVSYSVPCGPRIVQHALVMPGQTEAAPLFPEMAPVFGSSEAKMRVKSISVHSSEGWPMLGKWSMHTLQAILASKCARQRWADITGAARLCRAWEDVDGVRLKEKFFCGITPVPAAYRATGNGVTCLHCQTFHSSINRFVAACAPEYPEIAR